MHKLICNEQYPLVRTGRMQIGERVFCHAYGAWERKGRSGNPFPSAKGGRNPFPDAKGVETSRIKTMIPQQSVSAAGPGNMCHECTYFHSRDIKLSQ